jgi:uncharacterized protein
MPTLEQARAWYAGADPVHDFDHILRVYRMAERLGRAEGADLQIVRAAALLHDAEGSAPESEGRKEHHERSALFAAEVLREEGWDAERILQVQHCIRAHRFRSGGEKPHTVEAMVLFDADKLDVLGAVGAVRTVVYAALAGQPAYAEPSPRFLAGEGKESGEPHSSYHEYLFKLRRIPERLFTPSARVVAAERAAFLAKFYAQLIAEYVGER